MSIDGASAGQRYWQLRLLRARRQMRGEAGTVRIWDLPTRAFHWLLVAGTGFSWWSAESGEMDWHRLSGTLVLALVVFRLIWGFVGGSTARFSQFVRSPKGVLRHIRTLKAESHPGHNPLGGYSVIALLALVTVQLITGLLAVDIDGIESGPLSIFVSFEAGRAAAELHEISFNILLALIALHLLAILCYRLIHKQNLVSRMVTGKGVGTPDDLQLVTASATRFFGVAVFSGLLAWAAHNGFWM